VSVQQGNLVLCQIIQFPFLQRFEQIVTVVEAKLDTCYAAAFHNYSRPLWFCYSSSTVGENGGRHCCCMFHGVTPVQVLSI